MSSAIWALLKSMQTTLRTMTFQAEPGTKTGTVKPQNIIIRKVGMSARADEVKQLPYPDTPSIVVVHPGKQRNLTNFGENQVDWMVYPVLVQIVDNDAADREGNMETYDKWIQQVRRAFSCHDFLDIDPSITCAYSFTPDIDCLDEKLWLRTNGKVVAAVAVMIYSREPRGIEA